MENSVANFDESFQAFNFSASDRFNHPTTANSSSSALSPYPAPWMENWLDMVNLPLHFIVIIASTTLNVFLGFVLQRISLDGVDSFLHHFIVGDTVIAILALIAHSAQEMSQSFLVNPSVIASTTPLNQPYATTAHDGSEQIENVRRQVQWYSLYGGSAQIKCCIDCTRNTPHWLPGYKQQQASKQNERIELCKSSKQFERCK